MFLLVPAYPGCPGSKAVKRSLLLLFVTYLIAYVLKAHRGQRADALTSYRPVYMLCITSERLVTDNKPVSYHTVDSVSQQMWLRYIKSHTVTLLQQTNKDN